MESFLVFINLVEDLLMLSEDTLPKLSKEEVVCVLFTTDEHKEEVLEDTGGLGTLFREPPEAGIFETGAPLPEGMKLN